MKRSELINTLRNPTYPTNLSFFEAYGRAMAVAYSSRGSAPTEDMLIALHTLMNAIANEIEWMVEEE